MLLLAGRCGCPKKLFSQNLEKRNKLNVQCCHISYSLQAASFNSAPRGSGKVLYSNSFVRFMMDSAEQVNYLVIPETSYSFHAELFKAVIAYKP